MTISPGWYKDPAEPSTQRYWDGEGWIGDPLPIDTAPPDGPPPPQTTPVEVKEPVAGKPATPPPPPATPPSAAGGPARPPWAPATPLTHPVRPHGFPLASPGIRLAARFMDMGAILLLNVLVNGYFVYLFMQDFGPFFDSYIRAVSQDQPYPTPPDRLTILPLVIALLAMALWFAYEVPATANSGQTWGKRLYDIKVVRVESLEPIGFLRAWRRWNPLGGPAILLGFGLFFCAPFVAILQALDVIFVPLDRMQRMALHDRTAMTYVVQLPKSARGTSSGKASRKGK